MSNGIKQEKIHGSKNINGLKGTLYKLDTEPVPTANVT